MGSVGLLEDPEYNDVRTLNFKGDTDITINSELNALTLVSCALE
jgi:hypothetical protein